MPSTAGSVWRRWVGRGCGTHQGEEVNETQNELRPLSAVSSTGSIEELLNDFDRHLEGQRGCTEGTRKHYRREARALLFRVFPDQRINWDNFSAAQIADFVGGRAQKLSLVSRQNPATAIRSLLRFLTSVKYCLSRED